MPSKRVEKARELRKKGKKKNRTPEQIKKLVEEFKTYIEATTIPIVAEFAYKHGMSKSSMYDYPELVEPIKIAITKKEANLEKAMLGNAAPVVACIFSLKQLGWRDKQDVNMTHSITQDTLNQMFKAWKAS